MTSILLNHIARDEQLDTLDPLRHLMQQVDESDVSDGSEQRSTKLLSLLPNQRRSVHNETLHLSFTNRQDAQQPSITISLTVDASPGCGGIAWPAGEVY